MSDTCFYTFAVRWIEPDHTPRSFPLRVLCSGGPFLPLTQERDVLTVAASLKGVVVQRSGSVECSLVAGCVRYPSADRSRDVLEDAGWMVRLSVHAGRNIIWFSIRLVGSGRQVECQVKEICGKEVCADRDFQSKVAEALC